MFEAFRLPQTEDHVRILSPVEWLTLGHFQDCRHSPAKAAHAAQALARWLTCAAFPGAQSSVKVREHRAPQARRTWLMLEIGGQPDGSGLCLVLAPDVLLAADGLLTGHLYARGNLAQPRTITGMSSAALEALILDQG